MGLGTGDIIGLSILGAGVVGGGVFLALRRPASAEPPAGYYAPGAGPAQVQGTQGGGAAASNAVNTGLQFISSGVQLWNQVSALWS